ncbi:MAG TPA: molybdenum cofactor biosynthesis protein MoaE [bacterium]|nr:molybdenum cofactor biosynthesis protein MoaE [bacterium]
MIEITQEPLKTTERQAKIADVTCGAVVAFEGRVRDHHDGKQVAELRYECYGPMALKELGLIRREALERWPLHDLWIAHRVGVVPLGEAAVWVGASSVHRKEAFEACAWAMDEVKLRAPIWKKETYADGTRTWVEDNCVPGHRHHL